MERVMGIEPTRPAWKAGILPLNYTRTICAAIEAQRLNGMLAEMPAKCNSKFHENCFCS